MVDLIDATCLKQDEAGGMCFESNNHEGEHIFREIKVTLTPPLEDTKEK